MRISAICSNRTQNHRMTVCEGKKGKKNKKQLCLKKLQVTQELLFPSLSAGTVLSKAVCIHSTHQMSLRAPGI